MPDKLKKFLAEYNISSHTVAVALLGFAGLYTTDAQVQAFVNNLIGAHPTWIVNLTLLCGIVLKYSSAHSTQGQVSQLASTPPQKVADAITAIKTAEEPALSNLQNVAAAVATKDEGEGKQK